MRFDSCCVVIVHSLAVFLKLGLSHSRWLRIDPSFPIFSLSLYKSRHIDCRLRLTVVAAIYTNITMRASRLTG